MSLSKEISVDQVTVDGKGIVFIRETTRILDAGVEISKSYHRTSFFPGQDITGQPANVVAIATAAWTPEVVAAYQAEEAAAMAARASQQEQG